MNTDMIILCLILVYILNVISIVVSIKNGDTTCFSIYPTDSILLGAIVIFSPITIILGFPYLVGKFIKFLTEIV